ncbi:MAG TPA: ATP-binding protein [Bryobacteraceae bacterium]
MRCVLEVEQSGFLEVERRVLQLVAKGASMHEVLDTLTAAIEGMAAKCFCSILLLDEDKRHLRTGAGGSLPAEYMRLVDGLEIGPDVGSCGSAAFRNQTVIVSDIATDYRWAGAKELPLGFGLRACWSVPIRDSKDRVLGTFAMYHRVPATPEPHDLSIVEAGAYLAGNVIERLTADRKLREAVERLRLAEEAAGFGLWDLDLDNDVVMLSEGAAALNGLARKAARVSGTDLGQLIHPDDRAANATALQDAIRDGEAYQVEFRVILPDGSQRWCRARGRVERAGSKASRVIGAIIDITKEKAMMEQLRENERQLAHKQKLESIGELAAGVAHEINTPIQYIGDNGKFLEDAFTDLLKFAGMGWVSGPPGIANSGLPTQQELDRSVLDYHRAEVPKALHELQEGAAQVARIVRAMKEFSHPGPVERQSIDLNHAIESTILVASHEWKYVADVSTDLDPDLYPVRGLAGEINQVMLNLIVNAAHAISDLQKAPEEKGRIDIRTRQDGEFAEIRVSDTGCGIPESIQSKIFDPFFTTKPVGKGTGQGLALAYAVIVKKHNGTIRVESKPGQGTTFVIRLPLNS